MCDQSPNIYTHTTNFYTLLYKNPNTNIKQFITLANDMQLKSALMGKKNASAGICRLDVANGCSHSY